MSLPPRRLIIQNSTQKNHTICPPPPPLVLLHLPSLARSLALDVFTIPASPSISSSLQPRLSISRPPVSHAVSLAPCLAPRPAAPCLASVAPRLLRLVCLSRSPPLVLNLSLSSLSAPRPSLSFSASRSPPLSLVSLSSLSRRPISRAVSRDARPCAPCLAPRRPVRSLSRWRGSVRGLVRPLPRRGTL